MEAIATQFGSYGVQFLRLVGANWLLFQQTYAELKTRPFYFRLLVDQIFHIGFNSLTLVFVTAASTGMVMTIQFGFGLEKFGGQLYVPKIVGLSMVRELAPIFTSLVIAGRVGAGIASEIGSMVVTQQIDAIRAMGTSPIKKIVIPRVLATLLTLPLLTILANTIGIVGGIFIGSTELNLDSSFYFQKVISTVKGHDYLVGVLKTMVFALLISIPACYYGLNVKDGTRGVGVATTKAVVTGTILIFLSDFVLTKLFWLFER